MDGDEVRDGDGAVAAGGEVDSAGESTAAEPAAAEPEVREGVDSAGVDGAGAEAGEVAAEAVREPESEGSRAELETLRAQLLASHRRALLAENAGRVVPELVAGESVEALEASVEAARAAFEAVRQTTLAGIAAGTRVGPSNGHRASAVDLESMSPMQKIAFGLKRSDE